MPSGATLASKSPSNAGEGKASPSALGRSRLTAQADPSRPLLDVRGVTLQYKTPRPSGHRDLSRRLRRAASATASSCSGPSGCGKSTLLKAVGGYHARRPKARSARRAAPITQPGPRPHDGVPGIRPAAAVEDGAGRTSLFPLQTSRQARRGKALDERAMHYIEKVNLDQVRRQLSAHAVGRHEAARRDRARHGDGARYPADGRAVRRARRAHARARCRTSCWRCGTTRASPCCSSPTRSRRRSRSATASCCCRRIRAR